MDQLTELSLVSAAFWVILLFSVVALAVAIERAIATAAFIRRARALGDTVTRCLSRGALEAVILFNFFSQRANRIATELRLLTDEFLELLLDQPKETTKDSKARTKGDGDGDREAA